MVGEDHGSHAPHAENAIDPILAEQDVADRGSNIQLGTVHDRRLRFRAAAGLRRSRSRYARPAKKFHINTDQSSARRVPLEKEGDSLCRSPRCHAGKAIWHSRCATRSFERVPVRHRDQPRHATLQVLIHHVGEEDVLRDALERVIDRAMRASAEVTALSGPA